MTTLIGLVSDVHSSPRALEQALDVFAREGVDDIAGYYDTVAPTVALLAQSNCHAVLGNHDLSYLELAPADSDASVRGYLERLPPALELEREGKKLLVVHANPPAEQYGGIRLLDPDGGLRPERVCEWTEKLRDVDCDVLVVGHTHQVYALQMGGVFVVNPGSSAFNHSCMILSLPDLGVREFALGEREIIRCWNFSMLYGQAPGEA